MQYDKIISEGIWVTNAHAQASCDLSIVSWFVLVKNQFAVFFIYVLLK